MKRINEEQRSDTLFLMEPIIWTGKEYEYKDKKDDWYWILGIIVVALALVSILLKSYVFAIVVLAAGFALGVGALKRPEEHTFRIDDRGVSIGDRLYTYERIISFAIVEYMESTIPPRLTLRTRSIFAPELAIPLSGVDAIEIYDILSQEIEEHEHKESAVEHIAELFKF